MGFLPEFCDAGDWGDRSHYANSRQDAAPNKAGPEGSAENAAHKLGARAGIPVIGGEPCRSDFRSGPCPAGKIPAKQDWRYPNPRVCGELAGSHRLLSGTRPALRSRSAPRSAVAS
ncbi:hypothetical protein GCM10009565_84900 [Amycolatopsis albidoflavus]|uniref:hypothetical protein n=1 Tax=Amycolatopsis halotolerans TaxID=330083 RepID=UPI00336F210A